jgi:predicted adenylyl cyclase CyaB
MRLANIEIKARYPDLEEAARIAISLGAADHGPRHQRDLYYNVPRGRLKLRQSDVDPDELVLYLRPDEPGPRRADYQVIPVPAESRTAELLEAILGLEVVVEKVRRLFLLDATRIHLDEVTGLGHFIEFEAVHTHGNKPAATAARQEVERLIKTFNIPPADLIPNSYRELINNP